MFRNYLKMMLRNLKRNKGYAFINVVGLSIGMACCMLILTFVQDELQYDRMRGDHVELTLTYDDWGRYIKLSDVESTGYEITH